MMDNVSFVDEFNTLPLESLLSCSLEAAPDQARQALDKPRPALADFARLISPAAAPCLEEMAVRSQALTRRRFGKVMRLFAPLYLSNECVNNCKFSGPYLADCIRALHAEVPGISLELAPMETEDYIPLVQAGADGLVVYQETYDRAVYAEMHTAGPKRNFDWRLQTPERAYAAGFRRLGISPLYGLADWRREAICLAAHALYLLRHCWKAQLTVSLPRLRPCAGEFQPPAPMSERDLVQLVCALRLLLPDTGLVLSTRESAKLRDGLIPLGITMISAGSHTEPGGYTGAGREKLHQTLRGRMVELAAGASEWASGATGQFDIADDRSPDQVAELLRHLGYEPVWKDWDAALTA